jgi:hypothetical protein
MRKAAGRVNPLAVAVALLVMAAAVIFIFGRNSPTQTVIKFMNALVKGDVKTLTNLTYARDASQESISKQWDFAVNTAGTFYNFAYAVKDERHPDDNDATVDVTVVRDFGKKSSFPAEYSIALVKVNGEWKVDVASMSHEIYPALPRDFGSSQLK